MKIRNLFLTLHIVLLCAAAGVFSQKPCTNDDAHQTAGGWGKQDADDVASADASFSKTQFAPVLQKAQRVVELLKQATPQPAGVQAFASRKIRGKSYFSGGALPFGVTGKYMGYYCVPDTSGFPELRGKVRLGGETGTWIYIDFNSLGWLTNDTVSLGKKFLTPQGETIYYAPKQDGEFQGLPLLLPGVHSRSEAVVITPGNRPPFKPVSREQFAEVRERVMRDLIKESLGNAKAVEYYEADITKLKNVLNSMTSEERQSQAVISTPNAPPERLFVTEAKGGKRLVTVDRQIFNPALPRDRVQLITVYWRWEERSPPKVEMIRQFKANFDFQALRQMLGK